jgi:tetratricopeptide (TPR) repeat protein
MAQYNYSSGTYSSDYRKPKDPLYWEAFKLSKEERHAEAAAKYREYIARFPDDPQGPVALAWTLVKINNQILFQKKEFLTLDERKTLHHNLIELTSGIIAENPGALYSRVLDQAVKFYKKNEVFGFVQFFKRWGLQNLRSEDWQDNPSKDGKIVFPSVAKQAVGITGKKAAREDFNDPGYYQFALDVLDEGIRCLPNEIWWHWYKGKILVRIGRTEEAKKYFKEILGAKNTEFWAWSGYAELIEADEPDMALACYCRACSLIRDEKMGRQTRLSLAKILVNCGLKEEAKRELLIIKETTESLEIKPIAEAEDLASQPWYTALSVSGNNRDFYKEHAEEADSILLSDVPWKKANIGATFANKEGKEYIGIICEGFRLKISKKYKKAAGLKRGAPIRIKVLQSVDGATRVMDLEPREGEFDDCIPKKNGVVDNVNKKKNCIHILFEDLKDSVVPFDRLNGETYDVGELVSATYTEKGSYIDVHRIYRCSEELKTLKRSFKEPISFIQEERRFGKLDSDIFIPQNLITPFLEEGQTVEGTAIRTRDRKKGTWGWMAISLKPTYIEGYVPLTAESS